jgi:hypothetical protein
MGFVFFGLAGLCALGQLIALIQVIVKVFQQNQTGLAVGCIVLMFCGIGGLVTFIVGWLHANDWGLKKIMLAWTGLIVGFIVFFGIGYSLMPMLVTQEAPMSV